MDQVFAAVLKSVPAIVFVDEIDLLGAPFVSRLMSFMDGLANESGVITLAATCSNLNRLGSAFFRVGRFEHTISFKIPDGKERLAILRVHTRGMKLAPDVQLETLAAYRTIGMTGANVALICSQAAVRYIRKSVMFNVSTDELVGVSMCNFEDAAAALQGSD